MGTSDLQSEFRQLQQEAIQELRNFPSSGSFRQLFSIIVRPSFGLSESYMLHSPRGAVTDAGKKPIISQIVWRSDIDREKFHSPVERLRHASKFHPTMEQTSWEISPEVEAVLLDKLLNISIPLFVFSKTFGLDGTIYEFEYYSGPHRAALVWWEKYPEAWLPFIVAVKEVLSTLKESRPEASV